VGNVKIYLHEILVQRVLKRVRLYNSFLGISLVSGRFLGFQHFQHSAYKMQASRD
jgi:hypothetical protein